MSPRYSAEAVNRREFLRSSAAGLAAAAVSCSPLSVSQRPSWSKRPNVLFFFDDQLRTDACGVYGGRNISTPNIDRLAAQGITFTNALSTCPLCTPFRGMLQTGRYPTHSGLVLNWVEANPRQRCLAHVFRDGGYRTGFIGKWHLAAGEKKLSGTSAKTKADQARISQAIREYSKTNPEPEFVAPGPPRLGYDHWEAYNFHCRFRKAFYYRDTSRRLIMDGYETDAETNMAMEFMRQCQKSGSPFFLMVAPHPPHPPWNANLCPEGYLPQIRKDLEWRPNVPPDFAMRKEPLPARCYYAMAKNVDDNVGRLTEFLDQSALADNTVVVLTSDHGDMMGSHNRMNKMVPYSEAVRIPLIIRWPGRIPAGAKSEALFTPMDHLATLCGLTGLPAPDSADGVDLSRVVRGNGPADRDAVLMMNYTSHWDYFDSGTTWPEWRSVKTRQHTYVKWLDGKEELYDDLDDPYQMNNRLEGQKDLPTLQRLRGRLKDLLAAAHDDFLPGTAYADWYDKERNLVRTALGPV